MQGIISQVPLLGRGCIVVPQFRVVTDAGFAQGCPCLAQIPTGRCILSPLKARTGGVKPDQTKGNAACLLAILRN